MPVRIRLTRVGMKKQPSYRFVVTDSRNARDGRALETLGHYNPRAEPIEINVNEERAKDWLSKGAQPSDTVDRLFRRVGVLPERSDRPSAPARGPRKAGKQTKAAKRAAAEAAAPAPAAPRAQPAAEAAAPGAEPAAAAAVAEPAAPADDSTEVAGEAAAAAEDETAAAAEAEVTQPEEPAAEKES